MASNSTIKECIVCGKPFNAEGSAQTCSLECFESFLASDLGIQSEGGNLYTIEPQHNRASGRGGWTSPLNLTRKSPVNDPAAPWTGDRTKFIPQPRECPECGALLSKADGSETTGRPVVCNSCNASIKLLKPSHRKLQVRRTGKQECSECGAPLRRPINAFGFEGELECIKCGLVH